MSEKRRDNRGRILHNGESQRQDGRYAYMYKDLNRDLSLQEKERQIQQYLFNQIVPNGGNMTILELVENLHKKSLSAIGSMPGSKHIPCTTQSTTFA